MPLETPSQVPTTTPPFLPGSIPGIGGSPSSVPGQDPVTDKTNIIKALLQAATRKQMANTAVPMGIPAREDPNAARQIGMNTAWPSAWGTQRFLGTLGSVMKNAVAQQKENQVLKAEGDWTYLQSAMNELFAAQQSGDQAAVAAAQKKVDVIIGDQKKVKNMAKALNQDWLNPEKTNAWGEALKRIAAEGQQKDAQKSQAAHGIKSIIQKLLGQKQQLQLTAEEQRKMIDEIQAKAPTATTGIDKETALALREQMRDEARLREEQAKEESRQKAEAQKEEWHREEEQMKEKYQMHRDQVNNQFHQNMESMKEMAAERRQNTHDMMMMKALGMKLDAQQEKQFKVDEKDTEKRYNDSVMTLRQQRAQAASALRALKTSASNHWLMGPGKEEIAESQATLDNLDKAIAHLEKNRDAVVKGKMDMSDAVNKAYDLMGGGGESVPGFKPDK